MRSCAPASRQCSAPPPTIEVVGEAAGGNDAIALLAHDAADVVVMDLSMADGDGFAATRAITAGAASRPRVLVLTMHAEEAYLEAVLEAGASGYLVKSAADRELVEAVRAVARGEVWVQPAAARVLAQGARRREEQATDRARYERLTDRERAVMQLIAEGYTAPGDRRAAVDQPEDGGHLQAAHQRQAGADAPRRLREAGAQARPAADAAVNRRGRVEPSARGRRSS